MLGLSFAQWVQIAEMLPGLISTGASIFKQLQAEYEQIQAQIGSQPAAQSAFALKFSQMTQEETNAWMAQSGAGNQS